MDTVGEGKLRVLSNGKSKTGTWEKKSRTARTRFYDSKGEEIELARGRVWVEIVPPESANVYKSKS
jgi:hypothetical protein